MPFTSTQLEALKTAIAQGVTKVVFVDAGGTRQESEYRTLAEMRQIVAIMEDELGVKRKPGIRRVVQRHRSGLDE